jgi:cold shock CspA family protein
METDTVKHTTKLIGTVKRYDPDMGWGLISPHDGGNALHVDKAILEESGISTLEKWRVVLFEIEREEEWVSVKNLKVLSYAH